MFCPFWPLIKRKIHFYGASKKSLVIKVVGLGIMHIYTKNWVKIQKFAVKLAQIMVKWVESQVNSCLVPFFVKSFSLKPCYNMFCIFPRYYITYHNYMCWFAIFSIFLNHLCSHFKSRSNSRRPPSVLGGWGTKFCDGFCGYTPSGHLQEFLPNFFEV
jgi:hypothetical protein